jgi:hypothetical protein
LKWNHITISGRCYPLGEAAAVLHTATVGGNPPAWEPAVAPQDGTQHSLARASGAADACERMDSEPRSRTAEAPAVAAAAGGRSCTAQPRKWGPPAAGGRRRSHSRTHMEAVGMVPACTAAVVEGPACTDAEGHGRRRRGGVSRWRRARR